MKLSDVYTSDADVVLYHGDCLELLSQISSGSVQLVVTSPPYNIGKKYERKKTLATYLSEQATVISKCVEVLKEGGSICWEVGNHIAGSNEILPLDIALYPTFASHGLKLRNRIIWHFEHGLHCSRRLSGRYETILWFTKGDNYTFNLDPIRVPQKYPGKKAFKGPRIGQYTSHALGKNPGDVWIIPNVKHNHVEKTVHPCQFPVELVQRLVLALTNEGDLVLDPYMGVGSTAVAAVLHNRKAVGADIVADYIQIARSRVTLAAAGLLRTRPMHKPIYEPPSESTLARRPEQPSTEKGAAASIPRQLPEPISVPVDHSSHELSLMPPLIQS
ncbi:MAG: DNA-methyltransferase [Dehalococcoidia bacterium]